MLDFGWAELLLIIAISVLVIGPDELPVIMRSFGRVVRRFQYIKFAVSRQFDDFMQEHDLDEMRRNANAGFPNLTPTPEAEKKEDAVTTADTHEPRSD